MGEEQAVKNIMVKEVIAIQKDASVEELSSLLIENKISGVPVVDSKGTLVGIATEGDLIISPDILNCLIV
ncbi:MAG: CBS domain-containing protein [Actinomycetia bacterium]|nr:CBS domain-containing protein [Actinomycetes bacterium]